PRRDAVEQLSVDVGDAEPRIDEHDDRAQAAPHRQVLGHHLLPAQLRVALDRRITVAGQVREERIGCELGAELEEVDVLRPSGRLRGEGETLLLRQHIDRGRLAGVRAPDEGDLGQLGGRQLVQRAGGGEKTRGVRPGKSPPRFGVVLAWRFRSRRRGRHGGARRRREALIVKSLALAREPGAFMKPVSRLLCSLALVFTAGAPHAAETAASAPEPAKGAAISASVCAACHTNDGSRGAPANPIIQGQHPDYLVKQLAEFKAGKRDNPIMKAMAAPLSEADMKNVAAFYASKQPKPGFAKNKDLVALG